MEARSFQDQALNLADGSKPQRQQLHQANKSYNSYSYWRYLEVKVGIRVLKSFLTECYASDLCLGMLFPGVG